MELFQALLSMERCHLQSTAPKSDCITSPIFTLAGGSVASHWLQKLMLYNNSFGGQIPDNISHCVNLESLSLGSNEFVGKVPGNLGSLSKLRLLSVHYNNLSGEIPSSFGNLSSLEVLSATANQFVGQIPETLGELKRMRFIAFGVNKLSGEIPFSIYNLSSLSVFDFPVNQLQGSLPSDLGFTLPNLEYLNVGENQFTGPIPASISNASNLLRLATGGNGFSGKGSLSPHIGNLSFLRVLDLKNNSFRNEIPQEIGYLFRLRILELNNNTFGGQIPDNISHCVNLESLRLGVNELVGKVPGLLGSISKLRMLTVHYNNLSGEIPSSLGNLSSLEVLSAAANQFVGQIPETLGQLKRMRDILLGVNKLSGEIPFSIYNLSSLNYLDFPHNQLQGSLPSDLGFTLPNLERLNVGGNQFTGPIPASISNASNLMRLTIPMNGFSGKVPSLENLHKLQWVSFYLNHLGNGKKDDLEFVNSLVNASRLELLQISDNNFGGMLPEAVGNLSTRLRILIVGNNQLFGNFPNGLRNLVNLELLHLGGNQFTGRIPGSIGDLHKLQTLWLPGNKFWGEIPSSIGNLTSLAILDFAENMLEGNIPSSLGKCQNLILLDLSNNNLSGTIPTENLNLSFNHFEGEVPIKGVFSNSSAISLDGNDNLCGGISELHLSTCSIKESKQSRSRSLKLIIPVVTGILLVTGMSCLIITSWRDKSKRKPATPPSALLASILRVSYENLFKATDGFSLENLIGAGSFGSVYKGVLNHDDHETLVAVKVLNLQHRGASKSFMAECQALRSIRHRNLVKIITSCASVDFQGNDFEALVYEFMVNGSLEEWLHPNREALKNLNLLQRLSIAVDVASALDYLHHYCETPIVHCDLKPSNVLLDSELTAHVGDFGLAKFLPEATNNLSSNQSSSVGVKGTVGYAAPEYGMGSEVSTSGDVYSFGILLLEMFTGKRPTNEMFTGNLTLHNFVKEALPERLAEIVDPELLVEREEGETSNANAHKQWTRSFSGKECLVSVLGIGAICSSELPRERMSMEEVAAQLVSFRNKLVKNVRGQPAT
ncbi:hypothetical protein WN943_019923 [Citrus x changshan-huyou]